MFWLEIDTCVWLDLAKDHKQQALLNAIEELIALGRLGLILPRTIVEEFDRNKARVIEEANRSLSSTIKRVKDVVGKFGDPKKRRSVLSELSEVDHKIPSLAGAVAESVGRIEALFAKTPIVEITDAVKLRALQRGIDKLAPFHRQRNGVDDAILIEVYAEIARSKAESGSRYAFITHNTKDFSHPTGNTKAPHPDIAALFSRVKSLYFTTLGEALRRVDPEQFADIMVEQEWFEEPRRYAEIAEAIEELCTKIWYNRHQVRRERIEEGAIKLVDKATFPPADPLNAPIQRDVWAGALKSAAKVEKQFGLENLGPWTDFEWGMLSGKLSALRWVLGDEWDMLDT